MSNEIQVRSSLQIRNGNITYQGQPTGFTADMAGARGPTPGSLTITVGGANVDLSELSSPGGMARIQNLDPTNIVVVGIKDGITNVFYPMLDLLPGETYVVRLSRFIGEEEVGTGTFAGTTTHLHIKAEGGTCQVLVEAFDR